MPLSLSHNAPTLLVRRAAYEQAQLTRESIDTWLNLTPEEFRVEGSIIAVGPIYDEDALGTLVMALEEKGLVYFDDMIEMSGSLPEWLGVWVGEDRR